MKDKSEIVREFIEKVINSGEIDAASEYFWDDMVEEVPFPGQGPGVEGLKDVLRGMRESFPDMKWIVEEQVEGGDKVVTRFSWSGTHRAPFFGIPATERSVSTWGVVIDQFEGHKVKSTRLIMDALGLMAQLGAFPPGK